MGDYLEIYHDWIHVDGDKDQIYYPEVNKKAKVMIFLQKTIGISHSMKFTNTERRAECGWIKITITNRK